jgi:hypothetical protein
MQYLCLHIDSSGGDRGNWLPVRKEIRKMTAGGWT